MAGNFMEGNGLGGGSVPGHAPNANVDGNEFTNNLIGLSNVDRVDGAHVSPKDGETSGTVPCSAATPYHFVVAHNRIFDNSCGILQTPATVQVTALATNEYFAVTTPVFEAS